MLFPGGKEECHLGSVCDMWDGRPGNVTSGIGSLGISLLQNWDKRPGIKGGYFKNFDRR